MSGFQRGYLVTVAAEGEFGKPRPALVIQSDLVNESPPTVMLCLVTSELREAPIFRLTVEPAATNGLERTSQVQIDKLMTVQREKVGPRIGRLDDAAMVKVNRALAVLRESRRCGFVDFRYRFDRLFLVLKPWSALNYSTR